MRGAATQAMSDIVEERQQSRYAPLPPRRPCGHFHSPWRAAESL